MTIESTIEIPLHDGMRIKVWRDRTGGAAQKLQFPYDDLDIQGSIIAHSSDLVKMLKHICTLKGVKSVELTNKKGYGTRVIV